MRAMPASDRIDLSVQDTGIGIAAEHQVRIFDRFYRVAANRDTVPAGSGLGLALGRWIAERHGTELRVESEPGTGSRFSFSLQEADSAPAASAARPRPDSVDRFDDLRIRP
jgi:two-component system phosphate regulon sensor histidine kinase PhoR